jgi:hypothetical protein
MPKYEITPKALKSENGDVHRNAFHNVVAWGAIRELFRLNEGKPVSGEEIKKALEYCLGAKVDGVDGKPNREYFDYVTKKLEWLVEV